MAVIALASAKGSPGVTTTAVALTLIWPRPVLLVEADVSGSSSILAGYFGGRVRHDRGLVDLAAAHRQGRLSTGVRDSAISIGDSGNAKFLPGLINSAQVSTVAQLWEPLAVVLRGMDANGVDVIVDAGRLGVAGGPAALLREADATVLVLRTDLPAIAAARARAGVLREDLTSRGAGEDAAWALLVGEDQPFGRREVREHTGLPVAASIDWDPSAAQVVSHGKAPASEKKFSGSKFVRSTHAAVTQLDSIIRGRQEQLQGGRAAFAGQTRGEH